MQIASHGDAEQFNGVVCFAFNNGFASGINRQVDLVTADEFIIEQNVEIKFFRQAGQCANAQQ